MTIRESVDEVKLIFSRHSITLEADDPTIQTFVNKARRKTQLTLLGLYPECFGKILELDGWTLDANLVKINQTSGNPVDIYRIVLPLDFIDATVVILRYTLDGEIDEIGRTFTGETYDYECRRVDKHELYGVQSQSWNAPTYIAPVYALEKKLVDLSNPVLANSILYIGGINVGASDTLIDLAERLVVEVWYTAALPDLEVVPSLAPGTTADQELAIPMEFETLVIYEAAVDLMQKMSLSAAAPSVMQEIATLQAVIQDIYSTSKLQAGLLLPSKESAA